MNSLFRFKIKKSDFILPLTLCALIVVLSLGREGSCMDRFLLLAVAVSGCVVGIAATQRTVRELKQRIDDLELQIDKLKERR